MRVELLLAATTWLGTSAVLAGCGTAGAPDAAGDVRDASATDASLPADTRAGDAGVLDADAGPRALRTPGFAGGRLAGPSTRRYVARGSLIEDEITGLVWEAAPPSEHLSLAEARARCEALELEGLGDFRVPSRLELTTLLEPTRSPTIDPIFAAEPEYHWTRSLHPLRDTSASTVYFGAAEIVFALARDPSAVVRCVRGGEGEGSGPRREADGRVVDRAAALWWQSVAGQRTYAQARAACDAEGLRLPALDELASLIDDTRTAPAIDLATLGGEAGPTWSASAAQSPGERIGLDLSIGPSVRLREDELAFVRCVGELP